MHSYPIQIRGPIELFSKKWANGTKYGGLCRTSVGNVLIVELRLIDDDDDDDCPLIMRQKSSMHSMLVAQGRMDIENR